MRAPEIDELVRKGIHAAEAGDIHTAHYFLDQAAKHRNTPELRTYLAFCSARSHGSLQAAARACHDSIQREPGNSLHYLVLGRILVQAGEKNKAIKIFLRGLKAGPNPRIISELKKLGLRQPAVIGKLPRNHPLNRVLGKVLKRVGIR
jgi:uncharacterized protein HemY